MSFEKEIDSLIIILKTKLPYRAFNDPDDPIDLATDKLKRIGAPAVEPLIAALQDSHGHELSYTIAPLGEIGDARAVEPLIPFLKDSDSAVRSATAEALGKIRDARAVAPLTAALQDSDKSVRFHAALALGEIRDARAVDSLSHALIRDTDATVRKFAARALGEIGDKTAIDVLGTTSLNDGDKKVREEATAALKKVDREALAKINEEAQKRGIALSPGGKEIYDTMHSGKKIDEGNPIRIQGSEAIIYYNREKRWVLEIPTGFDVYERRQITLDSEQNPDRFVFDILQEAPSWNIDTPEGKLYKLMTSNWIFDFDNPIIIGGIAYVYKRTDEWHLRVPISREAVRDFEMSEIAPINENLEKLVMNTIVSMGLKFIGKR